MRTVERSELDLKAALAAFFIFRLIFACGHFRPRQPERDTGMSTLTLHEASRQWAQRPSEERYLSLTEMHAAQLAQRAISRAKVMSSRDLQAVPTPDDKGLQIVGRNGNAALPSHWAFGQLAQLVSAPASYIRSLPAPLAADLINFGLQVERDAQDVGILITKQEDSLQLRAATGPRYGRIWNSDVVGSLIARFGDGREGQFVIPGEFGRAVDITKDNTTLFSGDRDMFVFLADEVNRIELPNRRNGQPGSLARGFFLQNSEVGAAALKVKTFLFDYVCANRIVWGADNIEEISIRHNASAPDRFVEELAPALQSYANSSARGIQQTLINAQARKIDKVEAWLANRFGPRVGQRIQHAHCLDEGRPIETLFDAVTGATAYARSIPFQSDRVEFESIAGEILELAA